MPVAPGEELRIRIDELGLTQKGFAKLLCAAAGRPLGHMEITVSRWVTGTRSVNAFAWALTEILMAIPEEDRDALVNEVVFG